MRFRIRVFQIFQIIGTIAIGLVVGKRGVRTKAFSIDIEVNAFCQYTVARHTSIARDTDELLRGLVGDDIDDSSNSIGTIKRRSCPIEHFNTFHTTHVDTIQINIIRNVAIKFLSVNQDQNIFVA